MEGDLKEIKELIPSNFAVEWAIHKDRMERAWKVLDANSEVKFTGTK